MSFGVDLSVRIRMHVQFPSSESHEHSMIFPDKDALSSSSIKLNLYSSDNKYIIIKDKE